MAGVIAFLVVLVLCGAYLVAEGVRENRADRVFAAAGYGALTVVVVLLAAITVTEKLV